MVRMSTGLAGQGLLAAAAVLLGASPALAGDLAFDDPRLQAPDTLQVTIQGMPPGGPLPPNYTADGRNLSPPTAWTAGPAGTQAYVVVLQDPDAPGAKAAVHWLLYNVPGGVTALPRGLKNVAAPTHPLGAAQGWNDHGSLGYSGPRPPPDAPAHHYHLQVFALDRPARVRPGAELAAVERAMAGHVIARGELAVSYAPPQPKASKGQAAAQPSGQPGAQPGAQPGGRPEPGAPSGAPG